MYKKCILITVIIAFQNTAFPVNGSYRTTSVSTDYDFPSLEGKYNYKTIKIYYLYQPSLCIFVNILYTILMFFYKTNFRRHR